MEIDAIGSQFLNQTHIPFSSAEVTDTRFEEILKRTQNSGAVPKNVPIDKNDKLFELCLELETFLIKNLLKSMRNTVQKSEFINTGFAGEVYEDMLYDEYAKTVAHNASFGFAEMAYRDLSRGGF